MRTRRVCSDGERTVLVKSLFLFSIMSLLNSRLNCMMGVYVYMFQFRSN